MKKLTAGIFTALLGLVTVNAANAAIPSTNYVEGLIDKVRTEYQDGDSRTLESAEGYTDQQVGTLSQLTTTAQGNTVAAINEVNAAYKTADTNLLNTKIGTDAMGDIKTGAEVTDVVKPTTLTQAVNALNAKIDFKTSGIATDAALGELQDTVNGHETDISGLETRMGTAEGDIDDLEALVGTTSVATQIENANNTQTASLQQYADQAETDAIASAKAYADGLAGNYDTKGSAATAEAAAKAYADGLASNYDAAGAAATAQANAATYTDGKIDELALTYETKEKVAQSFQEAKEYAESEADAAETTAKSYADSLASNYDAAGTAETKANVALADAKTYADEKLALKVDKAQGEGAANRVVITDTSGNVTTSATIEQTQVNGLSDALAAKLPVTAANNADGKYVLTATALNGTITYAWEDISRDVPEAI